MQRRDVMRAFGALAAGAAIWRPARAQGSILVGQSAALTGPASDLGLQFKRGAELIFNTVNAQGGVGGSFIELRSLDDGYDPARCAQNTQRLVDEGAAVLFGYVGTACSLAALPIASAAQRLFYAPFTGSEAVRIPFNPLAFHVRASYVDETHAIVNHLTSVGIQRIGVFYQNDGDGKAGLLGVARALKLQYRTPSGLGFVERNSTNVDEAVRNVLAAKPDAIALISTYRSCAAFIRAARRAGFSGVFYNISMVGAESLARELGREAKGVVVSQVMPYPFLPTCRLAGDYLAAGRAADGDAFLPSYGSMEGYVAARTLVEALRRASGKLTPSSIASSLEALREWDMGGFRVDFGARKHAASRFVDLTILTADGRARR
jgi:ABC-type branched-subunit amino acid transport system substrate-binding protein